MTEYTPRRRRSSDQTLRGDFFRKPQPVRAEIARKPSRILPMLTGRQPLGCDPAEAGPYHPHGVYLRWCRVRGRTSRLSGGPASRCGRRGRLTAIREAVPRHNLHMFPCRLLIARAVAIIRISNGRLTWYAFALQSDLQGRSQCCSCC